MSSLALYMDETSNINQSLRLVEARRIYTSLGRQVLTLAYLREGTRILNKLATHILHPKKARSPEEARESARAFPARLADELNALVDDSIDIFLNTEKSLTHPFLKVLFNLSIKPKMQNALDGLQDAYLVISSFDDDKEGKYVSGEALLEMIDEQDRLQ